MRVSQECIGREGGREGGMDGWMDEALAGITIFLNLDSEVPLTCTSTWSLEREPGVDHFKCED